MLYLIFEISNYHYAITAASIVEVVPRIQVQKLPNTPEYFSGLMNYGGKPIPIIDFSSLISDIPSSHALYTRIVIMKNPSEISNHQLIGIIAEKVTQTAYYQPDEFKDSGVNNARFPFFGGIIQNERGMIRLINTGKLYQSLDTLFSYGKATG